MKSQNLYSLFLRSFGIAGAAALLLSFAIIDVSAQGGSGRITPTTGAAKKKATTTIKKAATTVKKSTTTSRNVKKPVTAAKNFNFYYNAGQAAYDRGDLPGAISNYTRAIGLNPRSADAYYNRGLAYYDSQQYVNAINDYSASIRILPQADAYNNRGLANEYAGNEDQAIADYKTALRLNPNYALARQNLNRLEGGNVVDQDDEGRAGAGTKNASVVTKPNTKYDAEYYNELADDQYDKGDFDNALINYTKSITMAPNDAAPYVRRGFIYHYTGYVDKAYKDYETASRLDPTLRNEAYIKCITERTDEDNARTVLSDCTKTIAEFPTFSLAYYKRGVAYREMNNLIQSMADFNKSVQLRPNFFNSIVYRGLIYEAQGNYNAAITEYTSAIRIIGMNDPRSDLSYSSRGRVYETQGKYSLAAADYRKAIQLNSNNEDAREGLTRVTGKQGGY